VQFKVEMAKEINDLNYFPHNNAPVIGLPVGLTPGLTRGIVKSVDQTREISPPLGKAYKTMSPGSGATELKIPPIFTSYN